MGNGFFSAFRTDGGPTLYGELKTAVTVDVLEAGFIFTAIILGLSLLLVLPGLHGREIIYSAFKIILGVFITASIILCNFGQEWEVSHVETVTQYRAGLLEEIHASMEVKIGLRSVNITLLADGETVIFNSSGVEISEKINYNERFSWDNLGFTQGRGGFGPFAGKLNQEYRAAQFKGVPYPILWVAEYFTLDGEGIRWGRFYRQAGYYTHIMMWLAFPFWCISMAMMHMVIRYGGYMSLCTGIILIIANMLFAFIRNPLQLKIPLGEEFLEFSWGWCFYLNLVTGIMCFIIGVIISIMDLRAYEQLADFFGADVLQDYEETYVTKENLDVVVAAGSKSARQHQNGTTADNSENDVFMDGMSMDKNATITVRQFRKRSTAFTKKFQKKAHKKPALMPPLDNIEMRSPEKKYIATSDPKTPSIREEDVFINDEDDYEDTEVPHATNRSFQYRTGSGPVDNNIAEEDDSK